MPGKDAWKRAQGHEAGPGDQSTPAEGKAKRLPAHEVDNAITDLELDLNLSSVDRDLTASIESVAGEPVSPTGTDSTPNPVRDLADNSFDEGGNACVPMVIWFVFLISLACIGLAIVFDGGLSFCLLLFGFAGFTLVAWMVGRVVQ